MARLERLRKQVVDLGIIPPGSGPTGLPSAVFYLKVKELDALITDPSLAGEYLKMAKLRSRKRRRKKHLKDKAILDQFSGAGHTQRLIEVITAGPIKCLGRFESETRFISETGFARSKTGFVYQVGDRRILLADSEAERARQIQGVAMAFTTYRGSDLVELLGRSEDRLYEAVDK